MSLVANGKRDQGQPDRNPDETEEVDLSTLLDIQDQRVENESKQSTKVILISVGCLFVAFLLWYAVSSVGRREVNDLIQNVKESRQDLDTESTRNEMSRAYDEMMAKLGSHSADIDRATRTLGVDPSTVKEDGMDAEMKEMMGGEGRTSGERMRLVEGLAQLAGAELPKPPAAEEVPDESANSKDEPSSVAAPQE